MHLSVVNFLSFWKEAHQNGLLFLSYDSYSEKSETLHPDVRFLLLIKTWKPEGQKTGQTTFISNIRVFTDSSPLRKGAALTGRIPLLRPALMPLLQKSNVARKKRYDSWAHICQMERENTDLFFFFSYVRFKLDWKFVERFCAIQKVLFPSCTSQSALMFGTLLVVTLTGKRHIFRCHWFKRCYLFCDESYIPGCWRACRLNINVSLPKARLDTCWAASFVA